MIATPFKGLTGPAYALTNQFAAIEDCINWFPASLDGGIAEPNNLILEMCPSNVNFSANPPPIAGPNRGLFTYRDTAYGVNNTTFFRIDITGAMTALGTVANTGFPCTFAGNYNGQIFICMGNGGASYVWNVNTSTFTTLANGVGGFLGAAYCTFQDGYVIVVNPTGIYPNQIQISGTAGTPVGDSTLWTASYISAQAGQADFLQAVISKREYLRLIGSRRTQVFTNNGSAPVPFGNYNQTFIETGTTSPWSVVSLGESLMWIGQDDRGQIAAWRDRGFMPERVSTYAIEQQWAPYAAGGTPVTAFAYTWLGHLFYQITFISNATWVYDATESEIQRKPIWHQRTGSNTLNQPRTEQFHCFCYGKHLVGDATSGAIYYYSVNPFYDAGASGAQIQIKRQRTMPHLRTDGYNRILYNRLELDLYRGSGGTINLSWSDDGGNTFTTPVAVSAGSAGDYAARVGYDRLGYSRNRVFRINTNDAFNYGILGGGLSLIQCAS